MVTLGSTYNSICFVFIKDVMDFVECNDCGKTLKVESLGAHYDRRHNPKSVTYLQPRTRCWGLNYSARVFTREPPSDDSKYKSIKYNL